MEYKIVHAVMGIGGGVKAPNFLTVWERDWTKQKKNPEWRVQFPLQSWGGEKDFLGSGINSMCKVKEEIWEHAHLRSSLKALSRRQTWKGRHTVRTTLVWKAMEVSALPTECS